MTDESQIAEKVRKAIQKEYNYLAYNLPPYDKKTGYEKGYLKADEETIETPPYSFGEVSGIVKSAFDELWKVRSVEVPGIWGRVSPHPSAHSAVSSTARSQQSS